MQKTGQIDVGVSPCEYCGGESVRVVSGIPVCKKHLESSEPETNRPVAIDKIAADLSGN